MLLSQPNSHPLVVIGGGPKAAALAARHKVLRAAGVPLNDLVIIEREAIGAHWLGRTGLTDGLQRLGTSALQDLGFPYTSTGGESINRAILAQFSWVAHLLSQGPAAYAEWIERNQPAPTHREWGRYLQWAIERSEAQVLRGTVQGFAQRDDLWVVRLADGRSILAAGVVVTGLGPVRAIPGLPIDDQVAFDGRSAWRHLDLLGTRGSGRLAIIGSGETAGALAACLSQRWEAAGDPRELFVVASQGTIYSRGENAFENQHYKRPGAEWRERPLSERRALIARTDRGVWSPQVLRVIENSRTPLQVVPGQVRRARVTSWGIELFIGRQGSEVSHDFDQVILATGFDARGHLRSLDCESRLPALDLDLDRAIESIDQHLCLPLARADEPSHLHVPTLAGLAQGPGFANLSCLGELADRIWSAYAPLPINNRRSPVRATTAAV